MNIYVRKSCLSFIILSALTEIIQANKNGTLPILIINRSIKISFEYINTIFSYFSISKSIPESNTDARQGRVTGRIVKLYSGFKPNPIVCLDEGFKADLTDCSVFYRCVKASHRGNFNIFRVITK